MKPHTKCNNWKQRWVLYQTLWAQRSGRTNSLVDARVTAPYPQKISRDSSKFGGISYTKPCNQHVLTHYNHLWGSTIRCNCMILTSPYTVSQKTAGNDWINDNCLEVRRGEKTDLSTVVAATAYFIPGVNSWKLKRNQVAVETYSQKARSLGEHAQSDQLAQEVTENDAQAQTWVTMRR